MCIAVGDPKWFVSRSGSWTRVDIAVSYQSGSRPRHAFTQGLDRPDIELLYPVVIINWVQYLGPPVPFSFPDSRDLLEVLVDLLTVFSRIDFPPLLRKGGKLILDD